MNFSTLFCAVISSCILCANCLPKKQDNQQTKTFISQITISKDHNECTNVPRDWSTSMIVFDSQPQCALLYRNRNCVGDSQTARQAFNGSTALSFRQCGSVVQTDKGSSTNKRINTFDLELLSAVADEKYQENVVISPASIKSILALLVEASSTDTEILRALQLKADDRKGSLTLLRDLQSHLSNKTTSNIVLDSRNRIYKANDVKVREEYETTIRTNYGADIESLDFSNPTQASTVVNNWVNDATRGLIPTILEEDQIKENTKLLLLNYVYFKAKWDIDFNPASTREDCFKKPVTGCQQVKFMYRKRQLNYTSSDQLQLEIFEIPFKDPRYTIVFMLPYQDVDIYDVLKNLQRKDVLQLFKMMKEETIHLRIPRTVVEFSSSEMIQSLQKVGIKSIFEKNAKLDKMIAKTSGWLVSNVVHKARIEMNEEGAQAAAVAGGNIEFLSLDVDKYVVVNRPYLFFLRDTTVPDFLFEGIVFSPEKAT